MKKIVPALLLRVGDWVSTTATDQRRPSLRVAEVSRDGERVMLRFEGHRLGMSVLPSMRFVRYEWCMWPTLLGATVATCLMLYLSQESNPWMLLLPFCMTPKRT
jgi:hypothetical protein